MAKNITLETDESVTEFLNSITDDAKRNDAINLAEIITKQTGYPAKMWGKAIIGFGSYHYKYDSGREGDAPLISFSPRAGSIALYFLLDQVRREMLLANLGKYKTNGGCIHIKKLSDVNLQILKTLIEDSSEYAKSHSRV